MNWFFGQTFAHQSMIWGGALMVASPIIIHIINRLRFRRVRFAAMEFLLESEQKNRRRILLEQMLLLALRILIVLAIAFLVARWIMGANQLAMLAGVKSHHVVLIDDSGSTRQEWDDAGDDKNEGGRASAFEKSKRVVEALAAEGERQEGTQQMTVLLLSRLDSPLYERADVDKDFLTGLKTKLKNLKPTHRSLQLADGVNAARDLLVKDKDGIRHLHVLSDYRQADWTETKALGDAVTTLEKDKVSVNLVKTVPEGEGNALLAENLGIVGFEGDLHIAATDVSFAVTVTVKNYGETTSDDIALTLFADGEKLPGIYDIGKIDPGETGERLVYVPFNKPGKHHLEVRLPEDGFTPDNSRHLAIDVADEYGVLIIDGAPDRSGATYLEIAIHPEDLQTGFAPIVQSPEYLRRNPLDKFSTIYMINVPELERDAVKPLEEFVAKGGGLCWYVGPQVSAKFYNETLYGVQRQTDEPGLFPVPLEKASRTLREDLLATGAPDVALLPHPIFNGLFEGQDNPFSELIKIYEYFPVDRDFTYEDSDGRPAEDVDGEPIKWNADDNVRKDGVQTIARLRNGDPLVFEHTYGRGRVLTYLTTANPDWNNWAVKPAIISYVPIVLEMQRRLSRTDHVPDARVVGEPIRFDLDAAEFEPEGRFETPDADQGSQKLLLNFEQQAGDDTGGARLARTFGEQGETDLPGIYRFNLVRQGAGEAEADVEQQWFAYNVPQSESALAVASTDDLRERLGRDLKFQVQEPGQLSWLKGEEVGTDVRRGLLFALILFLLCEQLLAWRLSFHPETAGASR